MEWIKRNKLTSILILVIAFFLFKQYLPIFSIIPYASKEMALPTVGGSLDFGGVPATSQRGIIPPQSEYPPTEAEDRLVVEESSMSLVVSGVREAADKVVDYAKQAGGFMVSRSLTRPEEAPFATVVVRVPADKFRETLDYCRNLAVKVSSENILGTDVTAEYVDIEARLATLEKTKAKFESILDQATQVEDILKVQRELVNLQVQIDNLKGRQQYLAQTAKLAKITAYLSTDELALPYAPAKPFRPSVIFKLAVRSLVKALRGILTALIWVGVYGVVWLPVMVIIFLIRKWRRGKASSSQTGP